MTSKVSLLASTSAPALRLEREPVRRRWSCGNYIVYVSGPNVVKVYVNGTRAVAVGE